MYLWLFKKVNPMCFVKCNFSFLKVFYTNVVANTFWTISFIVIITHLKVCFKTSFSSSRGCKSFIYNHIFQKFRIVHIVQTFASFSRMIFPASIVTSIFKSIFGFKLFSCVIFINLPTFSSVLKFHAPFCNNV